ncbi:hypothetical protein PFICI_03379 [Pestalotiopsis fici W106-1]|uniref:FAD dependent oxidoreductase domain-containing protein n=1 Tax=Pestalotiopsis fici (strain W106-1 / CGMCC3.15140) TaxID=1229662 RepID=W3XH83_PESFW|nr:uncharacterized protein PFICI_03379 [Pestalotiopsis fici W106-1]ETS85354.1 hypothetical protein PFICI_03379 [Pestalotiopsis fici W106-1]
MEQNRSGFPLTYGASVSDWLVFAQNDPLLYHRSSSQLPSNADIVIIGSGMTGTLVAKHCIEAWPDKKIVVLEARGFCSGATGRNAGHCKPDQYRGFTDFKERFGTEQSLKSNARPSGSCYDSKACYAWPAATLNPWKLAAHVMRESLKRGVNLQTRTEVSRVVHATNAYIAALEPSLRGIISPCPHICNKVQPPVTLTEPTALKHSYGVVLPEGGLYTINPQIPTKGPLLFGGSNPGQAEFGNWIRDHPERSVNDSLRSFSSVSAALEEFTNSQMLGWQASGKVEGGHYQQGWSGIIALVSDHIEKGRSSSNSHVECRQRTICRTNTRPSRPVGLRWSPRTVSSLSFPQQ